MHVYTYIYLYICDSYSIDDNDEIVYEIDTGTNYICICMVIYTYLF
jgi:hypothetical protein